MKSKALTKISEEIECFFTLWEKEKTVEEKKSVI
jgi:hypothetical protein